MVHLKKNVKFLCLPVAFSSPDCYHYVNERSVTMTKDDIIQAAFKVWGRDLYRTTSLSQISGELRVSKPALYRHFKDKDDLLKAMNTAFFDDCAGFIRTGYDNALAAGNRVESPLIIMRAVSEYYIRNKEAFVYSLVKAFNNQDKNTMSNELSSRGIDFTRLTFGESGPAFYPSKTQLIIVTLIFNISQFHLQRYKNAEAPSEDEVKKAIAQIENWIKKGLQLDERKVVSLNFERLEQQAAVQNHNDTENNAILRAVAEAVAEAGPWNASMEMVAKRSGLSKSGPTPILKANRICWNSSSLPNSTELSISRRPKSELPKYPKNSSIWVLFPL